MNRKTLTSILLILIIGLGAQIAFAAPYTQTIQLKSGWNSVFLEVKPDSPEPETVFASLGDNLTSVWAWNPQSSTVEFVKSPSEYVEDDPQLLYYIPSAPIRNLHAIHGNKAYLINMSADATLTVTGERLVPNIKWKPNSFNLVGFHLNTANAPIYSSFFAGTPAHEDQDMYRLDNASSTWVPVNVSDDMQAGEALWVYSKGSSEFNGPVTMQLERSDSLAFGDLLSTQDVLFRNNSPANKTIKLSLVGTADWLYYWSLDIDNQTGEWLPFPPIDDLVISENETKNLRLGVKRAGIVGLKNDVDVKVTIKGSGETYSEYQVPVSVEGIDTTGLWVGTASINKVSEVRINETPVPTGSDMSFRLLLHVGTDGVKILNQVIQMWDEDVGKPVLFTDDSLVSDYSGVTQRNGKLVGRRISAPAFGNFYEDTTRVNEKAMLISNGGFAQNNGELTVTIDLPADDPTNPFVHRYHPDHGVPDAETPEDKKFAITREITMTFQDKDSDGNPLFGVTGLGWGSSDMGGVYKEKITGLHQKTIYIEGTFSLHKVSKINQLTQASLP